MSNILLNSGGGIHVEEGNIQLATDPDLCTCCGPPQPPPPDCERCYDFVDDVVVFRPPESIQLAVVVSGIPDQRRWKHTFNIVENEIHPVPPSGDDRCQCKYRQNEFESELIINGFAALNGTYYSQPRRELPPGTGNSTIASCNPNGEAYDPSVGTLWSGCTAADICDKICPETAYHQGVLLTGTYTCTSRQRSSCNGVFFVQDIIRTTTATVEGFAYIAGRSFQYNQQPTTGMKIEGNFNIRVTDGYGTRCIPGNSPNFGGPIGFEECGARPFTGNLCWENGYGATIPCFSNYLCEPRWYLLGGTQGETCDASAPTDSTPITIARDAYDVTGQYLIPFVDRPPCAELIGTQVNTSCIYSGDSITTQLLWSKP